MTDRLKYINLYDYYGELLTEKQLYIVLATLNFFEFFFMLFMPETYGKHLPETIREMEESDNTLKENELKMIN